MTGIQIALGAVNIFCGCVFIGLAIPLVRRKIPRNSWYGVRIRKAFQSDELWYDINAYGGREFIIWSIPIVLTGIACFFFPLDESSPYPLVLALSVGSVVLFSMVAMIRTLKYAVRR